MIEQDFAEYTFGPDFHWLWIAVVVELWVIGVLILRCSKMERMESTKRLYLGYGTFMIAFSISRVLNYIANFYRDMGFAETDASFLIPKRATYFIGLLSLAFLVYGFERYFTKKTKGLVSLIPAIVAVLSLFLPYDIAKLVNYISTPIALLVILFVYAYMIKIGVGYLRKQAVYSLLGLFLLFLGTAFDSTLIRDYFSTVDAALVPNILGPVLSMVGLLIFYATIHVSMRKKEEIQEI